MEDTSDSIRAHSKCFSNFLGLIPFRVQLHDHLSKDFFLGALVSDFDSVVFECFANGSSMASKFFG